MDRRSLQELASALYAAPSWLRVRSVTIETADGEPLREVDVANLEDMEIPLGAFAIHVRVGPVGTDEARPRYRLALSCRIPSSRRRGESSNEA